MVTKAERAQRNHRNNANKDAATGSLKVVKHAEKNIKQKKANKKESNTIPIEIDTNSDGSNSIEPREILIEVDSDGDKNANPIAIDSDEDDLDGDKNTDPIVIDSDGEGLDNEITWLQECEIEEINKANDVMHLINTAFDDHDSSDDDEPLPLLWPVFRKQKILSEEPSTKCCLKSGKKHYQQPVESSDPTSNRMVPGKTPRSTDCSRRQKNVQALGRGNTVLSSWLTKGNPKITPSDPPREIATPEQESLARPSPEEMTSKISSDSEHPDQIRLHILLNMYLSAPKVIKKSNDVVIQPRKQWEDLNKAINIAAATYRKKASQNKKLVYPESEIANLNKFNHLRRQYKLDGTKSPSFAACLSTAESSIRRRSIIKDNHNKPLSGIYLARTIAKQARYVLNNKEISFMCGGNRTNHKSLINNTEIRQALFTWAASQIPGEVNPITFKEYAVGTVLPRFGIQKNIAQSTITRWMVKLGFSPQAYKKLLYFDGHERPDVVVARKKYIADYRRLRSRS
ncbi:hypothetical protein PSTG_14515 [Puccinia striiformis f. sp. tritici PST-78]|uniref:Uncharacterized protein n=1 Tax=Puccinia striiformis f. sp. tritici PST-78 TaxID=1165861 RepID=A0A0L0UYG3_9BASI|nr:hypothetical protein PSTG_14515 [Puccinia striiformis f. sp. tritici PST-78]